MSGIYIPGIEMPTSCIACHLNFGEKRPEYGLTICCPYSDGVISWRDKAFDNGRLSSCGIVPVPEHGDLIDLNAPFEAQYYNEMTEEWSEKTVTVGAVLYGCMVSEMPPVIIPTDKEEQT